MISRPNEWTSSGSARPGGAGPAGQRRRCTPLALRADQREVRRVTIDRLDLGPRERRLEGRRQVHDHREHVVAHSRVRHGEPKITARVSRSGDGPVRAARSSEVNIAAILALPARPRAVRST
ncbi:MAG: hypothetical protein ACRDTG_22100 [Pseudonocardiaceae bacterium]